MLRRAMASRVEIDLSSYDRLFPSQDVMPKGSFGNLIALPLQGGCRKRGTTVFLNPTTLEPYEDQWAFLSAVPLASPEALTAIADSVRPLPVGVEAVDWEQARDRHPAPLVVHATLAGMLSIERIGLPAWLIAQLKHLASLHNPKFYGERTPSPVEPCDPTADPLLRRGTRPARCAPRAARRRSARDRVGGQLFRARRPTQRPGDD